MNVRVRFHALLETHRHTGLSDANNLLSSSISKEDNQIVGAVICHASVQLFYLSRFHTPSYLSARVCAFFFIDC